MKRIKAACIQQTLHFMLKEDTDHTLAVQLVNDEVAKYKQQLTRNRVQHRIVSEEVQADGSIILKVIKQYNTSPVGDYLN